VSDQLSKEDALEFVTDGIQKPTGFRTKRTGGTLMKKSKKQKRKK